ncbi:MAG: aspartate--tRNA ligase [Planctomycetes bacterium]|nr:aspartate--tRNA ligase [Planctomycetota bacterium]
MSAMTATAMRTHTCGELRGEQVGRETTLCGWIESVRDHGGVAFVDLRDRYGKTQVVITPQIGAGRVFGSQSVWQVKGTVRERLEGTRNAALQTGEIEVEATHLVELNGSAPLPFDLSSDENLPDEEIRLQHRYLDLRRPEMQKRLALRHRVLQTIRSVLDRLGFWEIETPYLYKSTPEGAREFLVPCRAQPGTFYALPQSPQVFKQILQVAGTDRYMQIVRCFRDEDVRADRQPEFTQLDLEMSFVSEGDVQAVVEELLAEAFRAARGIEIRLPLPRLAYREAMDRYGSDKPDLRYGYELFDAGPWASGLAFRVLADPVAKGHRVLGLKIPAKRGASRKQIDDWTALARTAGAGGLLWVRRANALAEGPLAKHLHPSQAEALWKLAAAAEGDTLLLAAGPEGGVHHILDVLRRNLGASEAHADTFQCLWVTDFPLFARDAEGSIVSAHHPFTAPKDAPELKRSLTGDPMGVQARAYDLVINGSEVGGGSIRIHEPDTQKAVFAALGLTEERARAKFGFLLDALRFGAPPHGGIALGIDRLVALLAGTENIREVMAFPKTARGGCPTTGAPTPAEPSQLDALHIRTVPPSAPP